MLSRVAYILSCLVLLYTSFVFYPKWEKVPSTEATIAWDVSGYYWYLPATFIYKDLKKQEFADSILTKYQPTPQRQQSFQHSSGNWVNVYSSGMAVMYLPFFTVAHLVAKPLGYPADGFSIPYQLSIEIGSVLIALIGLWYYRQLLRRYFSDKTTAIMLLLLVIGTNYLNYSGIEGGLSHNWLFTLYVLLLLNTYNFYQTPSYKYATRIGLFIGLIALIRPTELIAVLIPLLWGVESISIKAIKQQTSVLKPHYKKVLITASIIALIGSIQVIYWLYVTGQPFVYSYEDKGFSWLSPHLKNYMFSPRSGWLMYTPLLLFSFIGLVPFVKYGKNKIAVIIFFFLSLYITSAWDIWWYGGTGGRAMIQSYPVILMPFATLIERLQYTKIIKWIMTPIILVFTYVNIWFTYNAHKGEGLYDSSGGMTKAFYWNVIGRFHIDKEVYKLKDTKEVYIGKLKDKELIYQNDFDTPDSNINTVLNGHKALYIDGNSSSPEFAFNFYNEHKKEWIRTSATYHTDIKEYEPWHMIQLVVRFTKTGNIVQERILRIHRYLDNYSTKEIYLDCPIPNKPFDSIIIFYWNGESDKSTTVSNLKVWSFNEDH